MDAATSVIARLSAWWKSLDAEPARLTSRERLVCWVLFVVVAGTRFLAVAKSIWDWDEALFALALRDYDVVSHHPHPPGFPLFVAAAKAVAAVTGASEFRSLQTVVVIGSLFVFPAMFALARELRADFFTCAASATLLAFMPNVWFFGGTAFSDVPSLALSLAACALLLRGCRSAPAVLAGFIVLGLAAGFRSQNLLICLFPMLVILVKRPRLAVAGAGIAATISAAAYGAAAYFGGGWPEYRAAVERHEEYIRSTDSFLSPSRPSLGNVADDFLVRPFRLTFANVAIAVLAVAGLLRRRPPALGAAAIFGPFLLFAWLMLDFHSSSRFSVAYVPLHALLAVEGASLLARARSAVIAALVVGIGWWMQEPLRVVRQTVSPPVAAAAFIRETYPDRVVLVDPRVTPLADLLLQGRELRVGETPAAEPAVAFREFVSREPGARNFVRPRARLSRALTRPRYFEMSVVPLGLTRVPGPPSALRAPSPRKRGEGLRNMSRANR